MKRVFLPAILLVIALTSLALGIRPAAAQQPGSILIWPINPVIEGTNRAAALWLENPGKTPVTLQVRVYAWAQRDGRDAYAPQDEILGTPPIVSIQPGERQLIRLTRTTPPPAVAEKSYRVIVDEIPVSTGPAAPGAAVSFRMRYSLPLFSYAQAAGHKGKTKIEPPAPVLGWRIGSDGEGRFLEIQNEGAGHARLTDVGFIAGATRSTVAEGLFGYVLPGATMRWPLPAGIATEGDLVAAINGQNGSRVERLPE
ncbi:MAG: molecular chaperone [Sphingopyxis sp.]|nr:molecular chaperone [Sphingopyxis sp.]